MKDSDNNYHCFSLCMYPTCTNLGESRGVGKPRKKWCQYHGKGPGKKRRIEYFANSTIWKNK